MFPHKNNEGYMNMGSLGQLHGMGNVHVVVRGGKQWWAGELSYDDDPGCICCALNSSIDAEKDVAIVVVMCCQHPDLGHDLLLGISCPPVLPPHNLLT